jgi:hypothetical protein
VFIFSARRIFNASKNEITAAFAASDTLSKQVSLLNGLCLPMMDRF